MMKARSSLVAFLKLKKDFSASILIAYGAN